MRSVPLAALRPSCDGPPQPAEALRASSPSMARTNGNRFTSLLLQTSYFAAEQGKPAKPTLIGVKDERRADSFRLRRLCRADVPAVGACARRRSRDGHADADRRRRAGLETRWDRYRRRGAARSRLRRRDLWRVARSCDDRDGYRTGDRRSRRRVRWRAAALTLPGLLRDRRRA